MLPVAVYIVLGAALLALFFSLGINAKQFLARQQLSTANEEYRRRLVGPGGHTADSIESLLRDLDGALLPYRGAISDQFTLNQSALRTLVEDLRVLSAIKNYGERAGWAHALLVIAHIRVRMVVGQFFLESLGADQQVCQRIDSLLKLLRSFAALQGCASSKHRTPAISTSWRPTRLTRSIRFLP
jgi:hypothetical protein